MEYKKKKSINYIVRVAGKIHFASDKLIEARAQVRALLKVHNVENHIQGSIIIEKESKINEVLNEFELDKQPTFTEMF